MAAEVLLTVFLCICDIGQYAKCWTYDDLCGDESIVILISLGYTGCNL